MHNIDMCWNRYHYLDNGYVCLYPFNQLYSKITLKNIVKINAACFHDKKKSYACLGTKLGKKCLIKIFRHFHLYFLLINICKKTVKIKVAKK